MLVDGPCRQHGHTIVGALIDCQQATRITSGFTPTLLLAFERALHEQVVGFVQGFTLELSGFLNSLGTFAVLGLSALLLSGHYMRQQSQPQQQYFMFQQPSSWGNAPALKQSPWMERDKFD